MINPMFGYRPKPKQFDLPLRYYDPAKDEREKAKRRIRFERNTKAHKRQVARVFSLIILLSFVVYIIYYLGRIG